MVFCSIVLFDVRFLSCNAVPPDIVMSPVVVRSPVMFVLSFSDMLPDPLSITMFPVAPPPMVRVLALVVESTPSPVRDVAILPEFADIEAVVGSTLDGADVGPSMTVHTWSAGVITTAGHSGSGVWEQTLICTLT